MENPERYYEARKSALPPSRPRPLGRTEHGVFQEQDSLSSGETSSIESDASHGLFDVDPRFGLGGFCPVTLTLSKETLSPSVFLCHGAHYLCVV